MPCLLNLSEYVILFMQFRRLPRALVSIFMFSKDCFHAVSQVSFQDSKLKYFRLSNMSGENVVNVILDV